VKVGEGVAGVVAKQREPVLVEDISQDPRFRDAGRDRYRTRSFISCPLLSKKKILGVLNINDKKDRSPFSQQEFELVKSIANHAAIAFENVLLLGQLKSKAADLEKINKQMIENNVAKNDFLTRISHELRTPLNSVKGAIYHLQEQQDAPSSVRAEMQTIIAAETDKLVALVDNLLNFLQLGDEERISEKTLVLLTPLIQEFIESRSTNNLLEQRGIRIFLDSPPGPTEIVGDKFKVMQLFHNLLAGISPSLQPGDMIRIIVTNTEYVEVVIDLPRQLSKTAAAHINELRHAFRQDHPEEIVKLYLARSIADAHRWNMYAENHKSGCRITITIPKSVKEMQDALINAGMNSFTDYIADRLNVNICSIMLSDDLTNELTVRGARGLADDVILKTRIRPGDRISGWVAMEGKPLLIENIEDDPRFSKKSIPQYYTKSLLSLPLKVDGRVVGVMNLNNKKTSEPFTNKDYAAALLISDKISEVLKSIFTDTYEEKDFTRLFASLDALLRHNTAEPGSPPKK
jgi:GAF domain-containing protein